MSVADALAALTPEPGLIILMCGVAGSGKTTFSKALEAKGFARLGLDEEIWRTFGRYGIDYPAQDYPAHVAAGRAIVREKLSEKLRDRTPTVVDSSFWSRPHREDFKALAGRSGCSWRLVYLNPPEAVLQARLRDRNLRFDANAAFPIDEAALRDLLGSFEVPAGEGEIIVTG